MVEEEVIVALNNIAEIEPAAHVTDIENCTFYRPTLLTEDWRNCVISADGKIALFHGDRHVYIIRFDHPQYYQFPRLEEEYFGKIQCISITRSGKFGACTSDDRSIRVFQTDLKSKYTRVLLHKPKNTQWKVHGVSIIEKGLSTLVFATYNCFSADEIFESSRLVIWESDPGFVFREKRELCISRKERRLFQIEAADYMPHVLLLRETSVNLLIFDDNYHLIRNISFPFINLQANHGFSLTRDGNAFSLFDSNQFSTIFINGSGSGIYLQRFTVLGGNMYSERSCCIDTQGNVTGSIVSNLFNGAVILRNSKSGAEKTSISSDFKIRSLALSTNGEVVVATDAKGKPLICIRNKNDMKNFVARFINSSNQI